jgi:YcxB-like protein
MSQDRLHSIEFQTDLKISDIYWLYFYGAIRQMLYGRWILAIILMVVVALGAERLAFIRPLLEPPLVYFLLGLLLYLALVRPYVHSRSLVSQTMGTEGAASYLLSEAGIDIRFSKSQLHHEWSAIRMAKQTSSLILLYLEGGSALVFPKRCFGNPQQLSDARAIIAAHVKSRKKLPYIWP